MADGTVRETFHDRTDRHHWDLARISTQLVRHNFSAEFEA
jgi:hypothetical protein